jgi:hypothetical protein
MPAFAGMTSIEGMEMPLFTVRKGQRYKAKITLSFLQRLATNEMVAGKFQEVGFTDVSVTGSGRTRHAEGLWPHHDTTAEIPSEIDHVHVVV